MHSFEGMYTGSMFQVEYSKFPHPLRMLRKYIIIYQHEGRWIVSTFDNRKEAVNYYLDLKRKGIRVGGNEELIRYLKLSRKITTIHRIRDVTHLL